MSVIMRDERLRKDENNRVRYAENLVKHSVHDKPYIPYIDECISQAQFWLARELSRMVSNPKIGPK